MKLFIFLLLRLLPLYGMIFLGFLAGKYLSAKKETLASILIYIIAPAVVFYGVATSPLSVSTLALPLVFFVLCSVICLLFYFAGGLFFTDSTKNILAFTAGAGNTGYFGLPVALALFGPQILGTAVLATLGVIAYENTLGFFITARGSHSFKPALAKVIKLPALYAFIVGLLANTFSLKLTPAAVAWLDNFKGAYTVFGMMIIGMGMAGISRLALDVKFTFLAFLAKFAVWPALTLAFIFGDIHFFHLYGQAAHQVFVLFSIVPLAANTVAYATELNAQPQKAAVAVLLSTLFALFYIPLAAGVFF